MIKDIKGFVIHVCVLSAAVLFCAKEAYVTSVPQVVSLKDMIQRSDAIIVGKRQPDPDNRSPLVHDIKVVRIIFRKNDLKSGSIIKVENADKRLMEDIGHARERKEPVPFPIIPTYNSTLNEEDVRKGAEAIFFLRHLDPTAWAYTVDSAHESLYKEKQVLDLLKGRSEEPPAR